MLSGVSLRTVHIRQDKQTTALISSVINNQNSLSDFKCDLLNLMNSIVSAALTVIGDDIQFLMCGCCHSYIQ